MSKLRNDFDPVSPNPALNETIFACAKRLPDSSARKVLKAIKKQHAKKKIDLADHTSRELLTAMCLAENGHEVNYGALIDEKTPDWPIFEKGKLVAIVECAKHNPSADDAAAIDAAFKAGKLYTGFVPDAVDALVKKISKKFKYLGLAKKHNVPYVISIFENFFSPAWPDEVEEAAKRVFAKKSDLSGLLYITEANGIYVFRFYKNLNARHPFDIPNATYKPPRPPKGAAA